jgi:hypothetical protein
MKLRNKKTGEIMLGLELSVIEYGFGHEWMRDWSYNSIKAFLEDWEDVKENSTAEPLIKDEKIRKAVRTWADVIGADICTYDRFWESFRSMDTTISFTGVHKFELEDERNYTIAELCGEEEE